MSLGYSCKDWKPGDHEKEEICTAAQGIPVRIGNDGGVVEKSLVLRAQDIPVRIGNGYCLYAGDSGDAAQDIPVRIGNRTGRR